MSQVPTIGVLAGMGPRSTAPFLERVVEQCAVQYGATADSDFPPIMVYSLPTPFTAIQPLDHDAMRRSIRAGLQRLLRTHVSIVGMPCNVAHVYWDDLVRGVTTPVLNLIDVTASAVPRGCRRVAVLSTRATAEAGLYAAALRERGAEVVDPFARQDAVDELLGASKAGEETARIIAGGTALLDDLARDGVDCVVLGSTDLCRLVGIGGSDHPRIVDSSHELARELVERWRQLRGGAGRRDPGRPEAYG